MASSEVEYGGDHIDRNIVKKLEQSIPLRPLSYIHPHIFPMVADMNPVEKLTLHLSC